MIAGRYSLSHETGRGGTAAVWLGRDEKLGRRVALKQVGPPGFASLYRDQAEREARAAASLRNPHAARVLDLVLDDETGRLWLVTEPADGTTLTDLVRRKGALPVADVAALTRQVAEVLAAAHAAGIVHRDVKPANAVVDPLGLVKVTDFGVTRVPADATRSHAELVTGSRAYLAPEVASGRTGDEASDVWSLGATASYALTGRPPYDMGDHVLGGLDRIVREDPPWVPDAQGLSPLLESTMAKDPARRWSMARVHDFLAGSPAVVAGAGLAVAASVPAAVPHVAPAVADADAAAIRERAPGAPRPGVKVALVAALLSTIALGGAAFVIEDSSDSGPSAGPHETTTSPFGPPVATPLNAPASSPVISASGTPLDSPSGPSSRAGAGPGGDPRSAGPSGSLVDLLVADRPDRPVTSRSGSRSHHASTPRSQSGGASGSQDTPSSAPDTPSSASDSPSPSDSPSESPSESPTESSSESPSETPSDSPTASPTDSPSESPAG